MVDSGNLGCYWRGSDVAVIAGVCETVRGLVVTAEMVDILAVIANRVQVSSKFWDFSMNILWEKKIKYR